MGDLNEDDHSIEPENSRDDESSVLDLPSQIIASEEEIQVFTQAISRKPRSAWYLRFFQPIEGSNGRRHKCIECGFEGMATSCALTNLLRHFSTIKYKECGAKYNYYLEISARSSSEEATNKRRKRVTISEAYSCRFQPKCHLR